MKLRAKILGSLFLLTLASLTITYFLLRTTLIKGMLDLEREDHTRNVQRVLDAIEESNRNFVVKLGDWSAWDDTYSFIETVDPAYIASNLGWNTFDVIEVNLLLYVDKDLHIKYFRGRDYTHEIIYDKPPAEILSFMRERKDIFNWKSTHDFKVGFVRSGNEVYELVLAPITNSDRDKPPRGTFFGARYFREARIKRLEEITQYKIHTRLLDSFEAADASDKIAVQPISGDTVEGKTILKDIFGTPIMELSVRAPRLLYNQGITSFNTIIALVIGICLALLLGAAIVLDRLMISRIRSIHSLVGSIQDRDDEQAMEKLKGYGTDEIGAISMEINELYARVKKLADFDDLTGLHNIRYFKLNGGRHLRLAQRHGRPLAVLLFDVDFFKKVNDTHGHIQGDVVLRKMGDLLGSLTRKTDICARYGGEEFTVVLLETDEKGAQVAAEKLRLAVEAMVVPHVNPKLAPLKITVSIGIAALPEMVPEPAKESATASAVNLEQLVERADVALYKAKESGRNRVVVG